MKTHNVMNFNLKFVILTIVLLALTSMDLRAKTKPTQSSATQITNKMQRYYAQVNDYTASFVQTTSHKLFAGKLKRSYGTVRFKNGGLMRWKYERPDKKLFIYDGTTLWIYESQVPQIFKAQANADRLRKGLAFLTGEGKINDSYKVQTVDATKYGFADGHVLKLFPREKNSPLQFIELYVNASDYRVDRSVAVDHDGNRNRLDFSNVSTNTSLPNAMFSFTPPEGVTVIDGMPQ